MPGPRRPARRAGSLFAIRPDGPTGAPTDARPDRTPRSRPTTRRDQPADPPGLRRGPGDLPPAGPAIEGLGGDPVGLRRRPVHAGGGLGRPDRLGLRALDPAGAEAAGARRGDAAGGGRGRLGDRRGRRHEGRRRGGGSRWRPRNWATRSTSRPRGSGPTAGTGIASEPATPRARSAGPGPSPRRRACPSSLRFAFASCQNYEQGYVHRL